MRMRSRLSSYITSHLVSLNTITHRGFELEVQVAY